MSFIVIGTIVYVSLSILLLGAFTIVAEIKGR